MRRFLVLVVDLILIGLATAAAALLRDNLEFNQSRFVALLPYLVATLCVSAGVLSLFGIPRAIWRFTALRDYLKILAATVVIVLGAVAVGFAYSRMEGIARAIPIIQGILIVMALIGLRILMRLRHALRGRPRVLATPIAPEVTEAVLIVGINRLSDLFMRAAGELAPARVRIVGLLGSGDRHAGLLVRQLPVLGTPEEIFKVLRDLEVHGIVVDRIVVTMPFNKLSPEAQQALLEVEKSSRIRVDFLAEQMGFDKRGDSTTNAFTSASQPKNAEALVMGAESLAALARRPYWRFKRVIDVASALFLLVILSPVFLMVGAIVALDVGLPVTFWQQRPGLGGRPFHLFKFRTMAAAHDAQGRRRPDDQRLSKIGQFFRRTRLDELPQLFNILAGDMSFIGPRPLLPVDQPADYAARLVVRPGLTGWAQVKGGRDISPTDKAALDIWYVRNASFVLDARILLGTVIVLLFGERNHPDDIKQARLELENGAILRSDNIERGEVMSPAFNAPKAAHQVA